MTDPATHPEHQSQPHEHHKAKVSPPPAEGHLGRKLTDEEINTLKQFIYEGPIHLVKTHKDTLAAVNVLAKETLLGFDIEKRPAFKKGVTYPPALLQLAGHDAVYIFQLHHTGLPAELTSLLSNPHIIKAGIAVARDIQELRELSEFQPEGFVDLGISAKNSGIQHHGLRGLAALMLEYRVSKSAKLTNWEKENLPAHALQYAATDAWMGMMIYKAMKKTGRVSLNVGEIHSRSRKYAVIFDMDGVLVDSYQPHYLSWASTCITRGFSMSPEQFSTLFGRSFRAFAEALSTKPLSETELQQWYDEKELRYREIIEQDFPEIDGVGDLVANLHDAGILMGIASSGPRSNVDCLLKYLSNAKRIITTVSADETKNCKPHPEPFLVCAEKLGVKPAQCVVIEDSIHGLQAARSAGMKAVGLAGTCSEKELTRYADLVIKSLRQLNYKVILNLIN